jgi:Tfp pilus assembly PilM family ATPase
MNALTRFFRDGSMPGVAVELAANRVSAARLEPRPGGMTVVDHAVEMLPDGALVASLTAPNLVDRAPVSAALNRVLDAVGRPRRIGLVVPDPVAKVSLLRFEKVPARAEDLDQLIKWQVRKTVPFPLEEAQVSYVRGDHADRDAFIVVVARLEIVREYEALCAEAGAHAGILDLSTLNVANAVLAGRTTSLGDWLLVNVAADYASLAILRERNLIFFRTRSADADETLEDLVHQSAMYYEDRLQGGGFRHVVLCGQSAADSYAKDLNRMRRSLEARLGGKIETADAHAAIALPDRIGQDAALLDSLAPLVGLLVRGREAA